MRAQVSSTCEGACGLDWVGAWDGDGVFPAFGYSKTGHWAVTCLRVPTVQPRGRWGAVGNGALPLDAPRGRGGKWGGLGKALPVRHTSHPNCYLIEMVAVETRPYLNTLSSTYLAFFSSFSGRTCLVVVVGGSGVDE